VSFYLFAARTSEYVLKIRHKKNNRIAGPRPASRLVATMALYELLRTQVPGGVVFTPEETAALGTAYEAILVVLRLNDRSDPITEIVATKVIEIFKSGERDPLQICNRTIKELGIPILEGGT
jgi:hypothetical protein